MIGGEKAVYWYANDGAATPTFTRREITTQSNAIGATFLSSTDLDADGDLDVLLGSPGVYRTFSGVVTWLEN